MTADFINRASQFISSPKNLSEDEQREIVTAFEETMAVAFAGWHEPAPQACKKIYSGDQAPLIDGTYVQSVEHSAFVHAVAAHALDYDDVHLVSITHPSAVIVPVLLAMVSIRPKLASRALSAYGVGLSINVVMGRVLGFPHYDKGWHATSTIGPIAGAAALAHLMGFDEQYSRQVLSVACAQAGGIQKNFGTDTKPVQAGFAAAAAIRAALLTEAGISGSNDAFGPRGFFDLYGGNELATEPSQVDFNVEMNSISRKLYPCCYAAHRLISAALEARKKIPQMALPDNIEITVSVPFGTMRPLNISDPDNGLEAKFCAAYIIAASLEQGKLGLPDFHDSAVRRPKIRELMNRIVVHEQPLASNEIPIGLNHGTVELEIRTGGSLLAESHVTSFPGSPESPATEAQLASKMADCLNLYEQQSSQSLSLEKFRSDLRKQIGVLSKSGINT